MGKRLGDSGKSSLWRSVHEMVFVRTLYIEKQSKNRSEDYQYVITINFVSTIAMFPDLPDPVHQALSLKVDLCKNSFRNIPFIS